MGKYDFNAVVNRHGTSCLKYDFGMQRKGRTDLLPLWVADMDFKLPEEILADFHKRIDHGIFGYTDPDQEYYAALDGWFSRRHGYHIDPKTVTVGCGVVYGLATGVKAFTQSGDAILIQQPVYYPFREVIEDNGRKFINNQLVYKDGKYSIDFADFEAKKKDNLEEEQELLKNALDGFVMARQTEEFPIAGMNTVTLDYLLAALYMETGQYDAASKMIGGILTSRSANSHIKDRAYDLKELLAEKKKAANRE